MAKSTKPSIDGKARLVFSGTVLKKVFAFLGGIVPHNPIVPILDNVLVFVQDGNTTFTATDLHRKGFITVPVDAFNVSLEGQSFLMPFSETNSLVSSMGSDLVTIIIEDDSATSIKNKKGTYKLAGENPIDWPKDKHAGSKTNDIGFSIEGDDKQEFIHALTLCAGCCDTDDLKPAMTGVNVRSDKDGIALAATDGHRLKVYPIRIDKPLPEFNIIIPKKSALILSRTAAEAPHNEPLTVSITGNWFLVSVGIYNFQTRLIDERFPDFHKAIPVDNPIEVEVNRAELLEALKRVLIVANKTTTQIRLSLSVEGSSVSAEDLDYSSEGTESLDIKYVGDSYEIGLNGKLLMNSLQGLDGETIRFAMSQPHRAVLLYGDDSKVVTLIMPCVLNSLV